ncbi:MAG: DUF1294 domain-containing protein [Thermoplasmatota archaeon]
MDPWPILAWVATASALAFLLAVSDKARARRGRRRVLERVLLGVAFAGGSPGLVLGMLSARHKVRKGTFLLGLAIVVALQAAVLWYWTR